MTIAWTYLDKRRAAEDAVKDFGSMEYIIDSHADVEEALLEDMTDPTASKLTGMPGAHDPQAGEARIVGGITEIDVLQERYRQALEFMEWFRPAWEELLHEEQLILREFSRDDVSKSEIVLFLGEELHLERAQVYRRKDKALNRLALLLYGK